MFDEAGNRVLLFIAIVIQTKFIGGFVHVM